MNFGIRVSDDKIIVIAKKDNSADRSHYSFFLSLQRLSDPGCAVLAEFSIDPDPSALETAQRISPVEYPVPNPDNHYFCQPLSFHRHRCVYDFFSDQPL